MAYVEERPVREGSNSGMVIVAIMVVAVLLLVAWMAFGRGGTTGGGTTEAPSISVPENVNVDVNTSGPGN